MLVLHERSGPRSVSDSFKITCYKSAGNLPESAMYGSDDQGWRKARLGLCVGLTLRAPLSGTFLQTLPDLVTPLKGHSLSPRICPATRSAASERFRYR